MVVEAEDWNRRYEGAEFLWTGEANRLLMSEVAAMAAGRALDIGCGEGRNAVWLARHGWTVTGVDFSAVGLEKARRLAEAQGVTVEWVLADLLDYQPPAGSFDLVVVLYLLFPRTSAGRCMRRRPQRFDRGAPSWCWVTTCRT